MLRNHTIQNHIINEGGGVLSGKISVNVYITVPVSEWIRIRWIRNTLASWFRIQRTTLLQKLKNFRLQRNANYLKNIKTFLIAKWFIKFSNENEPGV